MKKRYSIGLFILTIIIVFLFILIYRLSYQKALSDNEQRLADTKEIEECYYIKNTDGYVTVYTNDKKTVYEYTSILVEELPQEIQEELEDGRKVKTIGEIYGFLENYSS